MSNFPSEQEAIQLLKDAGCTSQVIQHCQAVATIAVRLAQKISMNGYAVDIKLVHIGALLHDIGRAVTHKIDHVTSGVTIAQSYGLSSSLIQIIGRHAGSGITRKEAVRLGLPIIDYVPHSLEEKIVTYADKLIEGAQEIEFDEAYRRFQQNLGGFLGSAAIDRLQKLHDEISQLLNT